MYDELAECGKLTPMLTNIGSHLDQFLQFSHTDAMHNPGKWKERLNIPMPDKGIGYQLVMKELAETIIPNGSAIPNPGCSSFITTGASNIGVLANVVGNVASPHRIGVTAFNYLEELSLQYMADMFELPATMKGIYSSGGSTANIVALGAARQRAFEKLGIDPAADGVQRPTRIYATQASHHTIQRAAAVLGLGRNAIVNIKCDHLGRMCLPDLLQQLLRDKHSNILPIAIVATAGITSTGMIDPLEQIGEIAQDNDIWFHVDGAYGLPGILDPKVRHLYAGLKYADSVIVDPHKWLGAPVGIGATFVKDRDLLKRAFTQQAADYLEGSFTDDNVQHSMDNMGVPYSEMGLELSAPSRGIVVWAILMEIGKDGLRERICRHNDMARIIAKEAIMHSNLELLQQPTLSICCFRYVCADVADLNELNRRIHRKLVQNGRNIPSTAMVNGQLAIRPCFIGAKTNTQHAHELVNEVLSIGPIVSGQMNQEASTLKDLKHA
jgi:glutamate/tyrosine decarboxylase-like PLP-dependent enzyme